MVKEFDEDIGEPGHAVICDSPYKSCQIVELSNLEPDCLSLVNMSQLMEHCVLR